jgi:4-amino-4-deoxy-L-arabinose transferase-like glycosyltransferase
MLLGAAFRLGLFVRLGPWTPAAERGVVLTLDAVNYHQLAVQLLESHRFALEPNGPPHVMRTPGYSAFLAAAYATGGARPWVGLLAQILLDVAACGLIGLALGRLFDHRVGVVAAFVYAVDPYLALYASALLLSDSLFVFLLVAALALVAAGWGEARPARRIWLHAALGGVLGLATLVRPIGLLVAPACALFLAARDRRPRAAVLGGAVALLMAFALVVGPWVLRNQRQFGVASLSPVGSYILLVDHVAGMEAHARRVDSGEERRRLLAEADSLARLDGLNPETANEFQMEPYWKLLAQRHVRADPVGFARSYTVGVANTFLNLGTTLYAEILGLAVPSVDMRRESGVDLARAFVRRKGPAGLALGMLLGGFVVVSYAFTAWGLGVGWARRRGATALCVAIALYFVVVTGPAGLLRYRLPAIPFYLPFTAIGVLAAQDRFVRRWSPVPNSFRNGSRTSGLT